MKRLSIFLIYLFISCAAFAQNFEKDIDAFIKEAMGKIPEVPGLAIAVVKDNQPLFIEGYGYADKEKNLKASTNTPFYIASTTQSFMGMLSVILEEEGKLKLDVPLTTYKPFKRLKNKDVFESITITDLLNHTSGIENGYLTYRDAYTGDKPLDVKIMLLEEATELKEKGKIFEYDNLGYNVLDVLLEAELGLDWRDLLKEKIFEPLGMERTSARISDAKDGNWGLAWPYKLNRDGLAGRVPLMKDNSMMQAAGGLITTADDVVNWLLFNLNGGKLNGKQVYSDSWVERTHQQIAKIEREGQIFTDKGYGLGWFTAKFKDKDIVYHFGGYPGFFAHISIMPEENLGVAVFANEAFVGDNLANVVATYAYDYFLNDVPENRYDDKLTGIRDMMGRIEEGTQRDWNNRKNRTWQLDLPMEAYEGEYVNKFLGTLKMKITDMGPHISLGRLNCIATPFAPGQMNVFRVEMIPGRGRGMLFKVEDGKVTSVSFQGESFERVK